MSKRLILSTILVAMTAALVHGLVLLAQTVTPPGKHIPSSQWKKELDDNRPALEMVAGQTATIVPHLVIRRRLEGPNNASVHTAEGDKQDVTVAEGLETQPPKVYDEGVWGVVRRQGTA